MKRIIFIIVITAIGVVASLIEPFWGLLLYSWYAFTSPLDLTYGALQGTRLSWVVGAVLIFTTLYHRQSLIARHWLCYACYLFLFHCFCSLASTGKYDLKYIFESLELSGKIILITGIMPILLDDLKKIRLYVLTVAASIGLLGAYYGTFSALVGSSQIAGPERIGDNNIYAVFLIAGLPYVFFSGRYFYFLKSNLLRGAGTFFLVSANIVAIILTYSRGGLLGLLPTVACLIFKTRQIVSRLVAWGIVLPLIVILGMHYFSVDARLQYQLDVSSSNMSPLEATLEGYMNRILTLRHGAEEESSARGRLHFWQIAWEMAVDKPVFGVGVDKFPANYDQYDFTEGEFGYSRAVHSMYMGLLAEVGFVGFFIFLLIVGGTLVSQSKAKKIAKMYASEEDFREISDYVSMLRISFLGFGVGAIFVTAIHQEIFWAMIGLSMSLELVAKNLASKNQQTI
jgi:putative inorganic carbon (hco3(-)) transporter